MTAIHDTLTQLGLPLLPVAPAFPAAAYPKSAKEPDKPKFTGKNPSYLTKAGKPVMVDHRKYNNRLPTQQELTRWFANQATGYGTKPGVKVNGRYFLAIDLDQKQFDSPADCDEALGEILNRCPALASTRIEQTRSGGYHLWVWSKEKPGFVNFALEANGPHRGEILGGKEKPLFMVIAPTTGYTLINDGDPVEIEDWSFLHPTGKTGQLAPVELPPPKPRIEGLPDIAEFFSPTAAGYYSGQLNGADNPSEAITTVLNECQGWVNWLDGHGITYNGGLVDVANYMARLYDRAHKIDRILKTIAADCSPACVHRGGDEAAWKKIRSVAPAQWAKHNKVVPLNRTVTITHENAKTMLNNIDEVLEGDASAAAPPEQPKPYHHNSLTDLMETMGDLFPNLWWDEFEQTPKFDDQQTSPFDTEPGQLRVRLAAETGFKAPKEDIADVVIYLSRQNRRNPIVEYLEHCHQRHGANPQLLADLGDRYFGSGGICNTFIRKTLIAAVARAVEPGCKQETALILQDPRQGTRKTDFFHNLIPEGYFDNSMRFDIGAKYEDQVMHLHKFWMVEWGEIDTIFRKRDASFVKGFLSIQSDTLRRPYMRSNETLPRPSIIIGTTNQSDFLVDTTGDRRFWVVPVRCPEIPIKTLTAERDQLWAAAYAEYLAWVQRGRDVTECPWWLTADEQRDATAIAQEFARFDPWHDAIADFVEFKTEVRVADILCQVINKDLAQQDGFSANRVADVLRQLGWSSRRVCRAGKRPTVWFPPEDDHPITPRSAPSQGGVIAPNPPPHEAYDPARSPDHPKTHQNFSKTFAGQKKQNRTFDQKEGDRVIAAAETQAARGVGRDHPPDHPPPPGGDRGDHFPLHINDYVITQLWDKDSGTWANCRATVTAIEGDIVTVWLVGKTAKQIARGTQVRVMRRQILDLIPK
ncbi:MAG: VapE domain-containing protein [Spirulinaceae cyanobacterium]